MKSRIKIGTRRSALALWQAEWVAKRLEMAGAACELIPMDTTGDKMLDRAIPEIGSKGVFTEDLEHELAAGMIDLAVHSAKDLPSELPDDFEIIAFSPREQPHDVLVSNKKIDLESRVTVGTSSTRRIALLKYHYPNVITKPVRGNLQTRIKKMESGEVDALMLAFAGVHRLGLDQLIQHEFPLDQFTSAVGQGSMAIEINTNLSPDKKEFIRLHVNHKDTESCLLAERAFLRTIQGGCSIPAFAHATLYQDTLTIEGGIIDLDGERLVRLGSEGPVEESVVLGVTLGRNVLGSGGAEILKSIQKIVKQ